MTALLIASDAMLCPWYSLTYPGNEYAVSTQPVGLAAIG